MNKIIIIGHLGQDPEVKETTNSTITKFSIAVKSGYGDFERTDWMNCQLWGDKRAEVVEKYLHKGSKVLIEGELHMEKWETKEGDKRTSPIINVRSFEFLDSKPDDGDDRRSSGSSRASSNSDRRERSPRREEPSRSARQAREYDDTEVPF